MTVNRGGFKSGTNRDKGNTAGTIFNDHIQATINADEVDGNAGDDVIIGYAGDDLLEGGTGQDDISGGSGNDSLIGGDWNKTADGDQNIEIGHWTRTSAGDDGFSDTADDVWTFTREFNQDTSSDDYDAESSFEKNGTDSIYGYDEVHDVIEIDALGGALTTIVDALDLADDGLDNGSTSVANVTAQDLIDGGYIKLEGGQLLVDLDGGSGPSDVWFNVKVDTSDTLNGATQTSATAPLNPDWANASQVAISIAGNQFVIADNTFA